MRESSFGVGLGISMLLAVAVNFIPQDAAANAEGLQIEGPKITCHSSSSPGSGHTFTQCSTCTSAAGIGSDAGQCRPN